MVLHRVDPESCATEDFSVKILITFQLRERMAPCSQGWRDVTLPLKQGTGWQWPEFYLGGGEALFISKYSLSAQRSVMIPENGAAEAPYGHSSQVKECVEGSTWMCLGQFRCQGRGKWDPEQLGWLRICSKGFNCEETSVRQRFWRSNLGGLNQEAQASSGYRTQHVWSSAFVQFTVCTTIAESTDVDRLCQLHICHPSVLSANFCDNKNVFWRNLSPAEQACHRTIFMALVRKELL